MGFDEASAAVVDYLKSVLPLGFWAVTRYDGVRQLYLEVRDDAYGLGPGGSHLWTAFSDLNHSENPTVEGRSFRNARLAGQESSAKLVGFWSSLAVVVFRGRISNTKEQRLVPRLVGVVNRTKQLEVDRVIDRRWRPSRCSQQRPPPDVVELKVHVLLATGDGAVFAVSLNHQLTELSPFRLFRTPGRVLDPEPRRSNCPLVERTEQRRDLTRVHVLGECDGVPCNSDDAVGFKNSERVAAIPRRVGMTRLYGSPNAVDLGISASLSNHP